jgi:hypothetical protein
MTSFWWIKQRFGETFPLSGEFIRSRITVAEAARTFVGCEREQKLFEGWVLSHTRVLNLFFPNSSSLWIIYWTVWSIRDFKKNFFFLPSIVLWQMSHSCPLGRSEVLIKNFIITLNLFIYLFIYFHFSFIIHMCIQGLVHFSPLPYHI